jgi:hypothetical protein
MVILPFSMMMILWGGCKEKPPEQLYFPMLKPSIGVGKVDIVVDKNLNLPTGGEVTVFAVVEPEVDRDELERLLQSFHRQIRGRRGFQKDDFPSKIDIRCYTDKASAEAGGDKWLARAEWVRPKPEPTFSNRQKPPLLKWAKQAFEKMMPLFSGPHKPQILADPNEMVLEVTYPLVTDDGSGQYVKELTHEIATTAFSSTSLTLFQKIPELKKLTFIGKHNEQTAIKVTVTAEQFKALNIKQVEELLGAYQGKFIELLMSKKITDEQVRSKVLKQRLKVYREAFAKLPKEQVELLPSLR